VEGFSKFRVNIAVDLGVAEIMVSPQHPVYPKAEASQNRTNLHMTTPLYSFPSSAEVENGGAIPTLPIRLNGLVLN
jgi:hypothetical protein